jgi:hypothetical protein
MKAMLSTWHWTRWLRLAIAVMFLVQGIVAHEGVALAAGAFFGLQALLNVGCCAVNGACRPATTPRTERQEDITWQEIR